MEFKRKRKRGEQQRIRRYWLSKEGYRVLWRKQLYGVQVPARFQATVCMIVPNYGGEDGKTFEMWDFIAPQRLFKTLDRAIDACERHKRLWAKACEATGIRGLLEIFGRLPIGIPVWARKKLPRKVYEILTRPRSAKYREDDGCPDDPASALPAREKEPLRTPSTTTTNSPVPPAKAPRKRAAKRTEKSSTPTGKRKRSTNIAKPSRGSAKSKPSAS